MCFKIEIYDTNTEDSCKSIGGIRKIQKNFLYLVHNSYTYILYSKDLNILLARLFVVNRLF